MATLATMAIGTPIRIQEGTANVLYLIAGFNIHGEKSATLVRKTLHSTSLFGSSPLYNGSTLDNLCNNTIYNSYPAKLRKYIRMADITCATSASVSVMLSRQCFPLSMAEVGLGNNGNIVENAALPFFSANSRRIINNASNTASIWRLRSWYNATSDRCVSATGTLTYSTTSTAAGVVPAFVLPSDRTLGELINADGSYNLSYADRIDVDVPFGTYLNRPCMIRTALQHVGVVSELYACNNFGDECPAWEAITDGADHIFANASKVSDDWKVGVRVVIERDGPENIRLNEFPILVVC